MELEINKKRVLFIVTQDEFGGAQRFIYELVTRLGKNEYEVMVAVGETGRGNFIKSLEDKDIEVRQLRFLKRDMNPVFDFLATIELARLIRKFKPDCLHLNSSKAGFLGSIAGFKVKKVIYRIGGWSFNDPWPRWKKKVFILAEKTTAKFKDTIVVNNRNDYEQALKLGIKPKKELKLVHNGIDALKIEFLPKDKARLKLKILETDLVIGTIANFYPTKGLPYLIKAAKLLKENSEKEDVKLVIIGDGEERKNIERLIEEAGLENEVILAGQIPEARKFMKAFDIFVLPSVKEGFPWVILDAMAAKLPVIATSVGALPEIIENGPSSTKQGFDYGAGKNGILVEPGNPRQLAEAIKYLLENERVRQELGIQAHQTVLFKFPVEKMVRETEELFN